MVYKSKKDGTNKVFPALEWLANLCSHVPTGGEQMCVIMAGIATPRAEQGRRREGMMMCPLILDPRGDAKAFRKSWARLIQKIYDVDPLGCPKCQATMQMISFIEDREVIKAMLKHLGLWLVRSRPPENSCPAAARIRH